MKKNVIFKIFQKIYKSLNSPDFEVFPLHLTILTILLVISYQWQKYEPILLGLENTFKKWQKSILQGKRNAKKKELKLTFHS